MSIISFLKNNFVDNNFCYRKFYRFNFFFFLRKLWRQLILLKKTMEINNLLMKIMSIASLSISIINLVDKELFLQKALSIPNFVFKPFPITPFFLSLKSFYLFF